MGILFLTIIYCLSISMNVVQSTEHSSQTPISLSQKDAHHKFIPGNQNSLDFQVSFDNSLESSKTNKENNLFKTTIFRSENSIFSQIKQYVFHSNKLLIRLRKNDYIFPFHYFW